jgi:hypothetical protein
MLTERLEQIDKSFRYLLDIFLKTYSVYNFFFDYIKTYSGLL